jgi:hypothetical protein
MEYQYNDGNKKLLSIAIAVFVLALGGLIFEPWQYFSSEQVNAVKIGEVKAVSQDVRYKMAGKNYWADAKAEKAIYIGDSIFTGAASDAVVGLDQGSSLKIDEKSLVTFNEEFQGALELRDGNFYFKVNGHVRYIANGEETLLSAQDAEVRVGIDEKSKKMNVSVVSGLVDVRAKGQTKRAGKGEGLVISKTLAGIQTFKPSASQLAEAVDRLPASQPKLTSRETQNFTYWLRYHDLYESVAGKIQRRMNPEFPTPTSINLDWTGAGGPYHLQVSQLPGFDKNSINEKVPVAGYSGMVSALGDYYWRVRREPLGQLKSQWTDVGRFSVGSALRDGQPLDLQPYDGTVVMKGETARLQWSPVIDDSYWLVEVSYDPDFPDGRNRFYYMDKPYLDLTVTNPGNVYWRVQGIDGRYQLSQWSETSSLFVEEPKVKVIPKVAKIPKPPVAPVVKPPVPKPNLAAQAKARKIAEEKARLEAERLERELQKELETQRLAEQKRKKRKPAAKPSISTEMPDYEGANYKNAAYRKSYFQLDGTSAIQVSSEQDFDFSSSPLSMNAVARVMYWWKPKHGLEGSLRTKLVGYNETGGSVSPLSLRARYHYRWHFPFRWWKFVKQMQLSLFTGVHIWRNNNSIGLFSDSYDLIDSGVALRFQIWQNWETGGEVAYGLGLDGTSKLEISGFLNYYLNREWSMGAGYRVFFLTAGSAEVAPGDASSYREGFGEGFGSLRRSF